jgi:hypothetical protein
MAHFAKLNASGVVQSVEVVHNNDAPDEAAGIDFLESLYGPAAPGRWVQTSYNGSMRKQFAGIGCRYDQAADVFIAPQPFPSWSLDAGHDWQPPTPIPETGGLYRWDEASLQWVAV